MGCGICAEVCPFDSIKMDRIFSLNFLQHSGAFLFHKEQLAKSNAYFHSIHSHEASDIDAQRAGEKSKADAKARAAAPAKPPPAANPAGGAPA
jgi:NADH-quinone oxidoreductase subunit I